MRFINNAKNPCSWKLFQTKIEKIKQNLYFIYIYTVKRIDKCNKYKSRVPTAQKRKKNFSLLCFRNGSVRKYKIIFFHYFCSSNYLRLRFTIANTVDVANKASYCASEKVWFYRLQSHEVRLFKKGETIFYRLHVPVTKRKRESTLF